MNKFLFLFYFHFHLHHASVQYIRYEEVVHKLLSPTTSRKTGTDTLSRSEKAPTMSLIHWVIDLCGVML